MNKVLGDIMLSEHIIRLLILSSFSLPAMEQFSSAMVIEPD